MNKRLKKILIIVTSFVVLLLAGVVLINWASPSEKSVEKNITEEIEILDPIPGKWKYHEGDSEEWAGLNYNDSSWLNIRPQLNLDSIPKDLFKGICWFRFKFSVNSSLANKALGIMLDHLGASEIYLDGKLLAKFGVVSVNKEHEKSSIPNVPVLFALKDTTSHCFAIRYSNHSCQNYYESYQEEFAGVKLFFSSHPNKDIAQHSVRENQWFAFILLTGFFITLCIVHLLLYLFYRKQKLNLYYAQFVFIFAFLAVMPYALEHTRSPSFYLWIKAYYSLPTIFILPSIVFFLHSLFKPKYAKTLSRASIYIGIAIWALTYFDSFSDYSGYLLFGFILFTIIEALRSVITGLIKKVPGAWIIAGGAITFCLILIYFIVLAFVNNSFKLALDGNDSIWFILLIILWVISIPLSMSIYLARDFSLTNKNLEAKLTEVEELSAKSIAQEKEKQHILASQNETLEKQVIERTLEITKQKHLIEEKNKEVMDSIRYAKRIQTALMTSEGYIGKALARLLGKDK